jgi:hypothetical protein
MAQFLTDLDARLIDPGPPNLWKLDTPFLFESGVLGFIVEVPAGFITDLASVPRFVLAYLIAGGRAPRAAVVHDYLCNFPDGTMAADGTLHKVPRAKADYVFLEAMIIDGVPYIIRQFMYGAVRAYSIYLGLVE